jgi:hypothetical protein
VVVLCVCVVSGWPVLVLWQSWRSCVGGRWARALPSRYQLLLVTTLWQ